MCSPLARSACTRPELNCDQYVRPSPDLTKTVSTPCARACAAIADALPPLALLTYQIHIASPSKAVPVGGPLAGGGVVIGFRLRPERGAPLLLRPPWCAITYARPLLASFGTRAIRRFELTQRVL